MSRHLGKWQPTAPPERALSEGGVFRAPGWTNQLNGRKRSSLSRKIDGIDYGFCTSPVGSSLIGRPPVYLRLGFCASELWKRARSSLVSPPSRDAGRPVPPFTSHARHAARLETNQPCEQPFGIEGRLGLTYVYACMCAYIACACMHACMQFGTHLRCEGEWRVAC